MNRALNQKQRFLRVRILCSMSKTTVLIGFAEALSAPEVAWSLVDNGFRVLAFTRKNKKSALLKSRHVICHEIAAPEVDFQASLADLQRLMASLESSDPDERRVLFPLDDKAVSLAAKTELENGWVLAGPSGANAELALNKCLQVQAARDAGFNVPETLLARNAIEVFDFCASKSFPIILRAADCVPIRDNRVQGCRNWICADAGELDRAVKQWGGRVPLMVQPFIEGIGEGIFGLAAPEGVRSWSGHRRLRMMNPHGSGSSACVSQQVSDEIRNKAAKLITRANWRGLFMIELLRDASGKTWFVELNGRSWGSMALSRRQGLEFPAWAAELALDENSQAAVTSSGAPGVVCRNLGRDFMHVLFVLRGSKSKALSSWPSVWKAIGDVMWFRRSDTYYNWRSDDRKVFFADSYNTIHDNLFKTGS
jgi:predicted ATP-grasp superfamily ATP-dependent carboligase